MKQIREYLKVLREEISQNGLILWGAGPNLSAVIASLGRLGFKENIVGVFDSTRELKGSEMQGVRIIPNEEVKSFSYDKNIIIGCAGLNELYGYIVPEHLFYFKIIHRRALEIFVSHAENGLGQGSRVQVAGDHSQRFLHVVL